MTIEFCFSFRVECHSRQKQTTWIRANNGNGLKITRTQQQAWIMTSTQTMDIFSTRCLRIHPAEKRTQYHA